MSKYPGPFGPVRFCRIRTPPTLRSWITASLRAGVARADWANVSSQSGIIGQPGK
ncbi:hypothetical protein TRAPUB_9940 [Trametes pubescens]|uniref:Uncharacterized protein n=1 Tax=Trametes pubescens TaxID=154538 RepID=A0A1M2W0Z5_TRAPU|nr:hypothetical protein TRAPUB_9940 [Trametes pubescens]